MSVLQMFGLAVAVSATFGLVTSIGVAFVVMMGLQYQDFMQRKRMEEAKKEAIKLSEDLRDEILNHTASAGLGEVIRKVH